MGKYNQVQKEGIRYLINVVPKTTFWDIKIHHIFGKQTNALFATFFLSLQKLEEEKYISLAHQAMFEDMLTFWTLYDSSSSIYSDPSIY